MEKSSIKVEEALHRDSIIFIDVRSPSEFSRGSIPNSVNLPLFDDKERAFIGRIYHHKGPINSYLEGLSIVAPKLTFLVSEILRICKNKQPILYCWRGGKRSQSLIQILRLLDIPALGLEGGYKSFYQYIQNILVNCKLPPKIIVLHGFAGAGKTLILSELREQGCPVIDLEGLAGHRGSVFGAIGMGYQPSQKDFNTHLALTLQEYFKQDYVIIENEGKNIGKLTLPPFLYNVKQGTHILINTPLEIRINRLVQEYIPEIQDPPLEKLEKAILKLNKRLGYKKAKYLITKIKQRDFREIARTLCTEYYDPFYKDSYPGKNTFDAIINGSNIKKAANEINNYINVKKRKKII